MAPLPPALSTQTVLGARIVSPHGEDLGTISDIVIDPRGGRVLYAVLSFGGLLGFGDKLFAVPWRAMRIDPEAECFVIAADREMLAEAPGFDKDHWPDLADPAFHAAVHRHFALEAPVWTDGDEQAA